MKNFLTKSYYRYILLFTSFLIISSACFIGISGERSDVKITRNKTVKTEDDVSISYDVYEPKHNDSKKYGVIIGHGFTSSKESMDLTALTLAKNDFVVITLDFRGHGRSGGTLDMGSSDNSEGLTKDILAVKTYLDKREDVIHHDYGIIGHSMGGRAAFSACVKDDSFTTMAGIAPSIDHEFIEKDRPENLLIVSAEYDLLFPPEINRKVISKRHDIDKDDVDYNKRYEDQTTSKIKIIPNADHQSVLWSSETHKAIKRWFTESYNIDEEKNSTSTLNIYTIIGLISASSAFFTLVYLINKKRNKNDHTMINTNKDHDFKELSKKYFLYSFLFTIPGFLIFSPLFLLPPLFTSIYIAILSGSFLGTAYLLRKIAKENDHTLKDKIKRYLTSSRSDYIYGCVYGLSMLLIVKIFISDHYMNLTLIDSRFVYFIMTVVILFFFFSVDDIFFFDILDTSKKASKLSSIKSIIVYSSYRSIYITVVMVALSLIAMDTTFMLPYAIGLFVTIGITSVLINRFTGSKKITAAAVSILTASVLVSITAIFDPISMIL
ncbi:MAG: alpha/beta hydrolase family protein [Thermoplasmata archaeon]